MQIIYLDADDYADASGGHRALQLLLGLPDYYGMNADALNDCLSERGEPVSLRVRHKGNEAVAETLRKVRMVVEDLGGTYTAL